MTTVDLDGPILSELKRFIWEQPQAWAKLARYWADHLAEFCIAQHEAGAAAGLPPAAGAPAAGAAAGASSAQATLAGSKARMKSRTRSNRLDILGYL